MTDTAIVLFDGDQAGANAAERVRAACATAGIDTTVSLIPAGIRDPEKFVLASSPEEVVRVFG